MPVQPIPGPGPRLQVSIGGGDQPLWSADGATLYYRGPLFVMSAALNGSPLRVTGRDSLFRDGYSRPGTVRSWEVFGASGDFLMLRGAGRAATSTVRVDINWPELLRGVGAPGDARDN